MPVAPLVRREPVSSPRRPLNEDHAPAPPAGWAAPKPEAKDGGRGELIGTAVQAVGEIAQIGLTYGGQALKQALSRLPKP